MMAMWAVRLLAQPPIQHWPFLARAAAHTALWLAWMLLLQYALLGLIHLMSFTHLRRTARPVRLHWAHMLAETVLGILQFVWPVGLLAAGLNPGGNWAWDFSCPNLVLLGFYTQATLMAHDTLSYFWHRWTHINKTAFKLLHAKHHVQHASLDVTSGVYGGHVDGLVALALPLLVMYGGGLAISNWWYVFTAVWNSLHLAYMGHCGHDVSLGDARNIPITLSNPCTLYFVLVPVRNKPEDHQDHHDFPNRNFAFYYSYWDEKFNTKRDPKPPCSLLVLAAHAVWQVVFYGSLHLLFAHFQAFSAAYLVTYVLFTPALACALAEWLRLPDLTRRLLGWLMDAYRADNCISYAAPGAPGAFEPAAPAATADCAVRVGRTKGGALKAGEGGPNVAPAVVAAGEAAAPDTAPRGWQGAPAAPAPVFLFACHPTGVLSRAAFLTFAARGWASPVSKLAEVRLAVGARLMRLPLPFVREFLLACGCIPADAGTLRAALRAGRSVAITPGGWREAGHAGSYNLVLRRRTGFAALALEAGAQLVPVLCLGEQDLTGANDPGYRWIRWLQAQRPHPVRVLFGQPLAPREGESVEQLHGRYVEALLQLGKQHDVALSIVE